MRTQPMSHICIDGSAMRRSNSERRSPALLVMPTKTHTGLLLALLLPSFIISATAQSGKDIPTIAREASPSVVRVVLRDEAGMELGSASGFVVNGDGRVVTNYHVIHIPKTAQADIGFWTERLTRSMACWQWIRTATWQL